MKRTAPKYPDWRWGQDSDPTRSEVIRGAQSLVTQYLDELDGGLVFDRHGRAYGFSVTVSLVRMDDMDDLDPRLLEDTKP